MPKNHVLILAIAASVVTLSSVNAQDGQATHGGIEHWRTGNWYNGYHEGHNGWWWIVDGTWTYYATPVYPYPDPNNGVAVEAAPMQADPSIAAGTAGSMHYYCTNPPGYYPAVPECNAEWQTVDASANDLAAEQSPQEADSEELRSFATTFDAIDPSGQQADAKLVQLSQQVEAYHQSLYRRSYNAMAFLEQSEALERRINDMRSKVEQQQATVSNSAQPAAAQPASEVSQTPVGQPAAAPQAAPETPTSSTSQY